MAKKVVAPKKAAPPKKYDIVSPLKPSDKVITALHEWRASLKDARDYDGVTGVDGLINQVNAIAYEAKA